MSVQTDWDDRRKSAEWALDTTGMAKSGYAPKKAALAEWVIEACDEITRLRDKLDRAYSYREAVENLPKGTIPRV